MFCARAQTTSGRPSMGKGGISRPPWPKCRESLLKWGTTKLGRWGRKGLECQEQSDMIKWVESEKA